MEKYFVYIVRCSDKSLYTGYCVDLKQRQKRHNEGEGAKYTKYRRPVKMVYSEGFESRADAMRRERQIKKWTRDKKLNLIKTKRTSDKK